MANLMIRIVTLATCSIALIAAFSVTPAVAAPGTEPGGSEADYSGMGQRSAYPPSSYPKRSGNKANHAPKAKKAKQSLFDDPAFAAEPFNDFYRQSLYHGYLGLTGRRLEFIRQRYSDMREDMRVLASRGGFCCNQRKMMLLNSSWMALSITVPISRARR